MPLGQLVVKTLGPDMPVIVRAAFPLLVIVSIAVAVVPTSTFENVRLPDRAMTRVLAGVGDVGVPGRPPLPPPPHAMEPQTANTTIALFINGLLGSGRAECSFREHPCSDLTRIGKRLVLYLLRFDAARSARRALTASSTYFGIFGKKPRSYLVIVFRDMPSFAASSC